MDVMDQEPNIDCREVIQSNISYFINAENLSNQDTLEEEITNEIITETSCMGMCIIL